MFASGRFGGRIVGDGPCVSGRLHNRQPVTQGHTTSMCLCTIPLIQVAQPSDRTGCTPSLEYSPTSLALPTASLPRIRGGLRLRPQPHRARTTAARRRQHDARHVRLPGAFGLVSGLGRHGSHELLHDSALSQRGGVLEVFGAHATSTGPHHSKFDDLEDPEPALQERCS
jgi:hypothetical protein